MSAAAPMRGMNDCLDRGPLPDRSGDKRATCVLVGMVEAGSLSVAAAGPRPRLAT